MAPRTRAALPCPAAGIHSIRAAARMGRQEPADEPAPLTRQRPPRTGRWPGQCPGWTTCRERSPSGTWAGKNTPCQHVGRTPQPWCTAPEQVLGSQPHSPGWAGHCQTAGHKSTLAAVTEPQHPGQEQGQLQQGEVYASRGGDALLTAALAPPGHGDRCLSLESTRCCHRALPPAALLTQPCARQGGMPVFLGNSPGHIEAEAQVKYCVADPWKARATGEPSDRHQLCCRCLPTCWGPAAAGQGRTWPR